MRGRVVGWLLVAATLGARAAPAADVPALDFRRFQPPADEGGGLFTEPARTPGSLNWNVALIASYAHRLVVLEDDTGRELLVPVRHQLSLDYQFGIGLGDRVALGAVLPSVPYQAGDDIRGDVPEASELPTSALGDLALSAKAILIPPGEIGGFGLGAIARVTLPTGAPNSYVSEDSATGELRVLSELSLVALSLRLSAGAKVRGDERDYVGETFGHELPWAAALVVRPQVLGWDDAGRWQWQVESYGAIALSPEFGNRAGSPAFISGSARYALGEWSVLAGVELPLSSAVGAPSVRGVLGIGWAPRFHDADGDGIEDEKDECAELAEDFDGFQDSDGCPDFDNDDDGVSDDADRCPAEREDMDGFEDDDGCLDPDNDHDAIPDQLDACPLEPGPRSADPKLNGCPPRDADMDGVYDPNDRCPEQAEDRDGFEDADGCPDPDNDGDGVRDGDDACPDQPGPKRKDPKLSGCPSPDRDGDSYEDSVDRCVDEPEDFDGVADEDGCPDAEPAKNQAPRARLDEKGAALVLAAPLVLDAKTGELTHDSLLTLRAIAQLLNQRPELRVLVGVRPSGKTQAAQDVALQQSAALAQRLRELTYKDDAAESVPWASVEKTPGAARSGVGVRLVVPPPSGKPDSSEKSRAP
jgi:hypothetical protein